MKQLLLLIALIASAVAAQAQTNVTIVLTVDEGVRVNSYTNSLSTLAVTGLNVAYNSYQSADTNNTASFRVYTRLYLKDLTEVPLKEIGRRYELQQTKVDSILTSITANWENASAADRKLLTDWLAKYPVSP